MSEPPIKAGNDNVNAPDAAAELPPADLAGRTVVFFALEAAFARRRE